MRQTRRVGTRGLLLKLYEYSTLLCTFGREWLRRKNLQAITDGRVTLRMGACGRVEIEVGVGGLSQR